jgi:putative transposase
MLAEGIEVPEVAKALEVSEPTYHRWRAQYGGMKVDDAKRLKELERENTTLKQIVADKELENVALREIVRETSEPVAPQSRGPDAPGPSWALGASACQITGQHRSTQRHEPRRAVDDGALRGSLR